PDRRHLPPSPTRRSSDLVYLPLYALSAGIAESVIPSLFALTAFVEILVLVPLATAAERYGSVRTLVGVCVIGTLSFLLVAVGTGDRKSTRLNSSHVKISY